MKAESIRLRATAVPLYFTLFLALILSTVSVVASPAGAHPIQALNPDMVTAIQIHKFEQPVVAGVAANGLPQDTTGLAPVAGATFTAKRVPGIDLTTNSGQREAAGLMAAEAADLVADEPVAAISTTDTSGNASLLNLRVGLYHVEETGIPAGYLGSAPFLVALPLSDPQRGDSWLSTVHVYPKNAKVNIALSVVDQDAVKTGDTIRWISRSAIPLHTSLDGYRVVQVINPHLLFDGDPASPARSDGVTVTIEPSSLALQSGRGDRQVAGIPGVFPSLRYEKPATLRFATNAASPGLLRGVDYRISYSETTRRLSVDFQESGLHKLEHAVAEDPGTRVRIDYGTTVMAEGIHSNEAVLYPSQDAIDQHVAVSDIAITKWGPLSVAVYENNDPQQPIAGAVFELYINAQDAFSRRNPMIIDGVSQWTTDENGQVTIRGLRFSEFANGLDREQSDELFRYYWVVPTYVPDGWIWADTQPLRGTVNSEIESHTIIYSVESDGEQGGTGRRGLIFGFIPIFWDFSSSGSGDERAPAREYGSESTLPADTSATATPDVSRRDGGLASTGAQVIGLVIFGGVLMIAGIFLVVGRRAKKEKGIES